MASVLSLIHICGQSHGISAVPQLFCQGRCADGLFTALFQTLQHGLLLFGTI